MCFVNCSELSKTASQNFVRMDETKLCSIFRAGMYEAKNTSRLLSVEFGRQQRSNYARKKPLYPSPQRGYLWQKAR